MGSFDLTAIGTLGKIKDPRAVSPLIDLIKSNEIPNHEDVFSVSYAAFKALREIKDFRAVPFLLEIMKDDPVEGACWATNTLQGISGKTHGQYYPQWKEWWDQNKNRLSSED